MEKKTEGIDKILRIIFGTALLIAGLLIPLSAGWRIVLCTMAAIALFTAFIGI